MNEKIKAILSITAPMPECWTKCDTCHVQECPFIEEAEQIYATHVKPLEDALEKAEAQNAATLAEHVANFMDQLGCAVTGDDGMVRMKMECTCPYCHHISYSVEEATAHDATCEKHPAVILAAKAEADKAVLVELVGIVASTYRDDADCDWIVSARAALARVKGDVCPKN